MARHGIAITTTVTAKRSMAVPLMGPELGVSGHCSRANVAHYELAAGRREEAEKLLESMEGFANDSGLLSEQVWDSPDIPEHQLYFGRPSGSAMPLVWAHAEYVKLRRSLDDGKVFDMPTHTVGRYLEKHNICKRAYWRFRQPCRAITVGDTLRLELFASARIRWSGDGWKASQDVLTIDTAVDVHYADLSTQSLAAGATIPFTFYWPESTRWEGENYEVEVVDAVDVEPRRNTRTPKKVLASSH